MNNQGQGKLTATWIVIATITILVVYFVPRALSTSNPESGGITSNTDIPSSENIENKTLSQNTDPYPGGNTPAPVPTLTAIPPGEGVYYGWTGEQIANVLIQRYETSNPARAISPTIHVYSVLVGAADADNLGIGADLITAESNTDYAIILGGQFPSLYPGTGLTPAPDSPYMLVVIDTDSGSVRLLKHAYDVQDLYDMLP